MSIFIMEWVGILYVMMREQYSKLGKSLFFYYATRLLAMAVIFYIAFAYVNQSYTHHQDSFLNYEQKIPFDRLAKVIQPVSDVAKSMFEVSQLILNENNIQNIGKYCKADQSLSDCRLFLLNSAENQLAYNEHGVYPSFQCL